MDISLESKKGKDNLDMNNISPAEKFTKDVLYNMQDAALECQKWIDDLSRKNKAGYINSIKRYQRRIIDIYDDVFSVRYLGRQYQAGKLTDKQLYDKVDRTYALFQKAKVHVYSNSER